MQRLLAACLAALLAACAAAPGTVTPLRCVSAGKRGVFYTPANAGQGTLRLAVLMHGLDGRDLDMVSQFRDLADTHRFVIVASDLVYNGGLGWTDTLVRHVAVCTAEVRALRSSAQPAAPARRPRGGTLR
jgi:poly(3-hydroxybutyrate) depolymerase